MKTLIFSICILGALLIQGCAAYIEPTGGYYIREGVWYYRDGGGREQREHGRYHHHPEDEHRDHDAH
ncbi:MAG TPA: hypothetical protein VK890_13695 [Bacteroidia bacterium]|jgi:hypothetical protein|nr:hypothetical protein [Bacteroidia bacterium]